MKKNVFFSFLFVAVLSGCTTKEQTITVKPVECYEKDGVLLCNMEGGEQAPTSVDWCMYSVIGSRGKDCKNVNMVCVVCPDKTCPPNVTLFVKDSDCRYSVKLVSSCTRNVDKDCYKVERAR